MITPAILAVSVRSSSLFAGWLYRKTITVDHTQVAGDLLSFPVLVSLATDSDLVAHAQSSGGDIVFSLDGVTKLAHELEFFDNATGNLVAWVRIPALSSSVDTAVYMYYGNAGAAAQQNPDGTWAGSFAMVQHLGESPGGSAPQFIDSAPVPNLASSFGFTSRFSASSSSGDAQGVATDGTSIWFSNSTQLRKYNAAGSLITSRTVTGDNPTDKDQINGLYIRGGVLYVCAAKYVGGVGTSYVVEYDPDTLAYITHHTLSDDAFCEGVAFYDGHWWVIFHASKFISKYDTSWSFVAAYDLKCPITRSSGGFGSSQGYDGLAFHGDYLYCNIHEIYNEDFVDVYHFNGASFDAVTRLGRPTSVATQGMAADPLDSSVLWFAERNTTDAIAKCSIANAYAKNNGTTSGAPVTATGKVKAGVDFDGVDDHIAFGTNARVALMGHQTFQAWVKPAGTSNYGGIVGKHEGNTNNGVALRWGIGSDGKFNGWVGDGSNSYAGNGTTAASAGTWYHVALVYDMIEVRIYVNGVFEDGTSDAYTGVVAPSSNPPYVGRYKSASNYYLNAVVDEARIQHTARSANWLLTEYRNQNSPGTFYAVGSQEAL